MNNKETSVLDEALMRLNYTKSHYNNETTLSKFLQNCREASLLNVGFTDISFIRNKAIYTAIKLLKYDENNVEGLTCDSSEFNKIFEVAEKYIRLNIFI